MNNSLSRQVNIFSLDTSCFYNEEENKVQAILSKINFAISKIKKLPNSKVTDETELKLKELMKEKGKYNKIIKNIFPKNNNIRVLHSSQLKKKKIISVFETTLTRTLGIETGTLSHDIIIVQTYFYDVLKDLVLDGFLYDDGNKIEKYVYFTASAGQIRTKKNVWIKEEIYNKYCDSLMCGLNVKMINETIVDKNKNLKGANSNKYLAYLSLSNTASEVYEDFNIDEVCVVDDMEFSISTIVDYFNHENYNIEHKKKMDVPINFSDGCGLILPSENSKTSMFRAPWIKGLLVEFPFLDFISEYNKRNKYKNKNIGIINDIYGDPVDIVKQGIKIILVKSQFKMYKFYNNWNDYKEKFKLHNCEAARCNEEDETFSGVKLNYQMLQTCSDISDKELADLSKKTITTIRNISRDRDTMLRVLGVVKSNTDKNHLQKALEVYPELLQDKYSKEVLKSVKKSYFIGARAAKLEVEGRYTYLIPDLYAFCEWTFLGIKKPKGLLNDGEVFCKLFKKNQKINVCRSPHLFREHGIRMNKINKEKEKWFVTNGIYTSVADNISKLIQNDFDGDKSIVISDSLFVKIAERNMKNDNIVPLYYEMGTADPEILSNESIHNGLLTSYKGSNIGECSNNISKVWNSNKIDLDVIRILTAENNYIIDYAKTKYKPTRPEHINNQIKEYTRNKLPHFFIYAKKKKEENVEPSTKIIDGEKFTSVINRLETVIKKTKLTFNAKNLGKFDYQMLMNDREIDLNEEIARSIIAKYTELDLKKRFMMKGIIHDDIKTSDELYVYHDIRNQILEITDDIEYIVDVLVKYLYVVKEEKGYKGKKEKGSKYKTTLWASFGSNLVDNLKNNVVNKIEDGYIICEGENCGDRFIPTKLRQVKCPKCQESDKKEKSKLRLIKFRNKSK